MNRRFLQIFSSAFVAFGCLFACLIGTTDQATANNERTIVTLIKVDVASPLGVVFDPGTRKMYCAGQSRIYRVALDGRTLEHLAGNGNRGARVFDLDLPPQEVSIVPSHMTLHPVTRQLYFVDRITNRILRLSVDGDRLELVAGTGSTAFDPRGYSKATEANICPSELVFHPKTHALHFVHTIDHGDHCAGHILRLVTSENDGDLVEVLAGTGNLRTVDSQDGDWSETDIEPWKLKFHPTTNELHFLSSVVIPQANPEEPWADWFAVVKLGKRGKVEQLLNPADLGFDNIISFGFQAQAANNLYALLYSGTLWRQGRTPLQEFYSDAEHQTYNPNLDEFYWEHDVGISYANGAGDEAQLISDLRPATADNLAADDLPQFPQFSKDTGVYGLQCDPSTGNLFIFLRGGTGFRCDVLINRDQFTAALEGHERSALHAIASRDEAALRAVLSDLRLLSAKPSQLLQAVSRAARGRPEQRIAGNFLPQLPRGVTNLIISYVEHDPHQVFRSVRAQRYVQYLEGEAASARAAVAEDELELDPPFFGSEVEAEDGAEQRAVKRKRDVLDETNPNPAELTQGGPSDYSGENITEYLFEEPAEEEADLDFRPMDIEEDPSELF